MILLLVIGIIILFAIFPLVRCIMFNLHNVCIYSVKDLISYIKEKKWTIWQGYGFDIYVGMFGHGKTLSAVKKVYDIKKRFPYVHIISNVPLLDLDSESWELLENYRQIIDSPSNTVILIDEISTLFNSRAYKDFPVELLFQILQVRKNRKQLIATAQRFHHVDKLMRDITSHVIDCNKYWRFQINKFYDAWDYENVMNINMIKSLYSICWFVKNKHYNQYDTRQLIKKDEFISNKEVLDKRCPNVDVLNANLSKKGKKYIGK